MRFVGKLVIINQHFHKPADRILFIYSSLFVKKNDSIEKNKEKRY